MKPSVALAAALVLSGMAPLVALAAEAPPQPLPESVWREARDGGLEHLQSGLVCPARLGLYDRGQVSIFDPFGLDVGCDYQGRDHNLTLYLTRRTSGGLDEAMAEAKRELVEYGSALHPQFLSDRRYDEAGQTWSTALYAEDGGRHTGIWMTDLSGWTLEYRVTWPLAVESEIQADIRAFTTLAAASAGQRLALCAKTPPPERHGAEAPKAKDDGASALMDALLGGAAIQAAKEDKHAQPSPIIWCVERPLKIEGHSALYWRGADQAGSDARTDKVTALTMKTTPGLTVAPNSMVALIESLGKKDGDAAPARWVATWDDGQRSVIFGYFTDRPSPEALSDLFGRIMDGKAQPLASYDASHKNITISVPKE